MSTIAKDELLKRLEREAHGDGSAWQDVAAHEPKHVRSSGVQADDPRLAALLDRINRLTESETPSASQPPGTSVPGHEAEPPSASTRQAAPTARRRSGQSHVLATPPEVNDAFVPLEPESIYEAGFTDSEVEALILKYLNARSEASGRDVTEQIKLPFRLIDPLLHSMKTDRLVGHKGAALVNDYVYQLTELGRERARKLAEQCTYFGAVPVTLEDYNKGVAAQSITLQQPTEDDLRRAFRDLLISPRMLRRLGPAINSGRGLFLYGPPGNGKTSIAERITISFGETIWIPRALGVDGEIMRVFDPSMHEPAPLAEGEGIIDQRRIDKRWIRIRRPTIIVGGELTMDQLEVSRASDRGVNEAPIQLKSNCGTLVIDDFGRQKMSTDQLLNRWIVPLEKRYDFLNLAGGKKIQVPFDQLIVFSTNLEPRDLVDDAFLRRIPYKIEITDPSEEDYRQLMSIMAPKIGIAYDESAVNHLIEKHYRQSKRPFRCCQPRDLLSQIRNYCRYVGEEPRMSPELFDFAVENYFAVM
jgi:hypothetical protein